MILHHVVEKKCRYHNYYTNRQHIKYTQLSYLPGNAGGEPIEARLLPLEFLIGCGGGNLLGGGGGGAALLELLPPPLIESCPLFIGGGGGCDLLGGGGGGCDLVEE